MHQDLARRAREGDHDAFSALVRETLGRLYTTARLILHDAASPTERDRDPAVHDETGPRPGAGGFSRGTADFAPMSVTPPEPKPQSAAPRLLLLTAIVPGLGHLVAGRRLWALILALPFLALIAAILIALTGSSATSLAARLFDPTVLGVLLVLQASLLLWRLFALGAVRLVTPIRPTAATLAALVASLAIIVGPQLVVASLTIDARDAATEVFAPVDEGSAWVPEGSVPPVASDDPDFEVTPSESPDVDGSGDPDASASASPSPTPAIPRINVLLIGVDSGRANIHTFLTDTMIVASLDPVGKTVSMVSIPRDMVDVPLPDGRSYRGKINGLVAFVNNNPRKFPGAKDGQSVLAAALGELLGLKLDSWAQVNLPGFVSLVDAVGGINMTVTDGFCDYRYKEFGIQGFNITPGRYHFDGEHALAYARIRKAAGESDFTRQARQQEVIAALRDKIVKGDFLQQPGKFLRGVGETISTNIKPSLIADYIDVASRVQRDDTYRVVISRPLVRGAYDDRGSIQKPQLDRIRRLARRLFTAPGVTAGRLRHDAPGGHRRDPDPVVVEHLRRHPDAPADAEADGQAHPEADGQAHPHPGPDPHRDPGADDRAHGRAHADARSLGGTAVRDPREIRLPDPSLVVLIGAAGSGKSTFAARHFAPDEVLSSDAFRGYVAGDPTDQRATRAAFSALHAALDSRLRRGRLSVVDATSVKPAARSALLRLRRRRARAGRRDRAGPAVRGRHGAQRRRGRRVVSRTSPWSVSCSTSAGRSTAGSSPPRRGARSCGSRQRWRSRQPASCEGRPAPPSAPPLSPPAAPPSAPRARTASPGAPPTPRTACRRRRGTTRAPRPRSRHARAAGRSTGRDSRPPRGSCPPP